MAGTGKKLLCAFASAVLAGIMIGIGGMAYLSCADKQVGALLFCVGLFTICTFGLRLYTGRVGYVLDSREFADLGVTWLGNLTGAVLAGAAAVVIGPELGEAALSACRARFMQHAWQVLVRSALCGMLMYVAVDSYRNVAGAARYLGILLCVPAFILSGFEHSVANMFYFALSCMHAQGQQLAQSAVLVIMASLGNALGAWAVHYLVKCARRA